MILSWYLVMSQIVTGHGCVRSVGWERRAAVGFQMHVRRHHQGREMGGDGWIDSFF